MLPASQVLIIFWGKRMFQPTHKKSFVEWADNNSQTKHRMKRRHSFRTAICTCYGRCTFIDLSFIWTVVGAYRELNAQHFSRSWSLCFCWDSGANLFRHCSRAEEPFASDELYRCVWNTEVLPNYLKPDCTVALFVALKTQRLCYLLSIIGTIL